MFYKMFYNNKQIKERLEMNIYYFGDLSVGLKSFMKHFF